MRKRKFRVGMKLFLNMCFISQQKKMFIPFIFLCLLLSVSSLNAQQTMSISGRVSDISDNPLPGVTVVVKGTTVGTTTDGTGYYSFDNIPSNETLIFSFIGMETQEISVEGRSIINTVMQDSSFELEELVAVGYSAQRKVDLIGSVAVADVEQIQDRTSSNVMQSLQGQVPGLFIEMDGNPSSWATVRVRGNSTLNNNDPLYIIDGVPTKSSAFQILNPADIKSIQVLKDASSAAIYGSRASNGVIIIETKNATQDKVEVNYSVMLTHSAYTTKPDLLNATERATVAWRAMIYDGGNPDNIPHVNYDWSRDANGKAVLNNISFPEYIVPGLKTANTNWFDTMSRSGFIQEHNLSVSSGTKNTGTRMSLRYHNNKYIHKFRDADKFSFRVNSFQKLFDGIVEVGQNLTVANNNDRGYNGNVHLDRALKLRPLLPVYFDDGTYSGPPSGAFTDDKNPLMILDIEQDDKRVDQNVFGSLYANIQLMDNLKWNNTIGIDLRNHHNRNIDRSFLTGIKARSVNSVNNHKSKTLDWMFNSVLQYDLAINKHNTSFLFGTEVVKNTYEYNNSKREGFAVQDEDYFYESAGSGNSFVDGGASGYSLLSYFGKVNYSAYDKYLASITLRYDGTSRVGFSNRFGFFPAFAAGWRLSEESFIKDNNDFLSDLKLRAAWGRTGNQEISTTATYTIYQPHVGENAIAFNSDNGTTYDIDGQGSGSLPSGYRKAQTGNDDLKWEGTSELNFGVDFGTYSGLSMSFDYFKRTTNDILISPSYLAAQGEGGNRWVNGASVENQGFELLIGYHNNIRAFNYAANFNIGHYSDKITKLPENVIKSYPGNAEKNILGRSMNSLFGYVEDGIFQNEEEVNNHAVQPGKKVGRLKFKDLNNDGKIDLFDQDWLGTSTPKYEFGLNLSADYHGFDFNVFFQGVLGKTVYESFKRYTDFSSLWAGTNWGARLLDAWSPDNPNSNIPSATLVDENNEGRYSSYFLSNGSYLKLRSISLGYTLSDIVFFKRARIFISGENLLTISHKEFDSPDPENPGNGWARPQNITFGVNLTF